MGKFRESKIYSNIRFPSERQLICFVPSKALVKNNLLRKKKKKKTRSRYNVHTWDVLKIFHFFDWKGHTKNVKNLNVGTKYKEKLKATAFDKTQMQYSFLMA